MELLYYVTLYAIMSVYGVYMRAKYPSQATGIIRYVRYRKHDNRLIKCIISRCKV